MYTYVINESTEVPNAQLCSVPQKEHTFPSIYSGTEVVRNAFCEAIAYPGCF